jgi:hypothetical protein
MENADDSQRLLFRVVHNQVVGIRLHHPEADRQGSQLFPDSSRERRFGKEITSPKDRFLNPFGCCGIVLSDETPNVEEIGYSLRRELYSSLVRLIGVCAFQLSEPGTYGIRVDQFSALGGGVAFVNLGGNLYAILGQPSLLFVQHGNRALHKFIHVLVRTALHVPLNQVRKLRPKANFHGNILTYGGTEP